MAQGGRLCSLTGAFDGSIRFLTDWLMPGFALRLAIAAVVPATLLAIAPPRTATRAAAARADSVDIRGAARAVADSIRPRHACAVAPAGFGGATVAVSAAVAFPAALAAALGVPLAAPGTWPACARPGTAGGAGVLVLVVLREVAPDDREVRVRVGLRFQARPDVPRSGYAEDWTYRVVRGADGQWRVAGRSDRRIT